MYARHHHRDHAAPAAAKPSFDLIDLPAELRDERLLLGPQQLPAVTSSSTWLPVTRSWFALVLGDGLGHGHAGGGAVLRLAVAASSSTCVGLIALQREDHDLRRRASARRRSARSPRSVRRSDSSRLAPPATVSSTADACPCDTHLRIAPEVDHAPRRPAKAPCPRSAFGNTTRSRTSVDVVLDRLDELGLLGRRWYWRRMFSTPSPPAPTWSSVRACRGAG